MEVNKQHSQARLKTFPRPAELPGLSPEEEMSYGERTSISLWHELDALVQQASALSQAGIPVQHQLRQLRRKLLALRAAGACSSVDRILHTDVPLVERILPVIDLRLNERSGI